MKILMDAGPWLAVPPRGYGGAENVVATLVTELRRRGHHVVLATVADSDLPVEERVATFPTGQFTRLAGFYPGVVGIAHAHEQVVLETIGRHAAAGEPFDIVHTHLEVVGPAVLGTLGEGGPPVLATLHWDLHRYADFWAGFDGGGRVFFTGVSTSQVARGPERLRRQTLGAVPLAVPLSRHPYPATPSERRPDVVAFKRITPLKGTAVAVRAAQKAGLPIVLAGRWRAVRTKRRCTRTWPIRARTCTPTWTSGTSRRGGAAAGRRSGALDRQRLRASQGRPAAVRAGGAVSD